MFGKPVVLFGVKMVKSPKRNGQYLAVMDKNVFNEASVYFMRKSRMHIYIVTAKCTDESIVATLVSTVKMKLVQIVPGTGDKIILLVQLSKPLPDFEGAAQKEIDEYNAGRAALTAAVPEQEVTATAEAVTLPADTAAANA